MKQLLLLALILIAITAFSQNKFQYSVGFDLNYSGTETFWGSDQINISAGPSEYILSIGIGVDATYQFQNDQFSASLKYKRLGANRVIEQILPEETLFDVRLDILALSFGYRIFPITKGAFVELGAGVNYIFNVSNEGKENFDVLDLSSKDRIVPSVYVGIGYDFRNGHKLSLDWNESLDKFYDFTLFDMAGNPLTIGLIFRSLDLSYTINFSEFRKFWNHD